MTLGQGTMEDMHMLFHVVSCVSMMFARVTTVTDGKQRLLYGCDVWFDTCFRFTALNIEKCKYYDVVIIDDDQKSFPIEQLIPVR